MVTEVLFSVALVMPHIFLVTCTEDKIFKQFPKSFSFGVASSAYQVEGAACEDGKGENIWDYFIHAQPDRIENGDNADVACDSYHKYKEDVQMIKEVGFRHYRFSISWSRILPNGHENYINRKGLQYYHNLIDELLKNGIEPLVTMYHMDLPQPLQELGGWANPVIARYFESYARILFTEFGNKVNWWITINEPIVESLVGYGQRAIAPGVNQTGIADYLVTYTQLVAHSKVYNLYKKHFAPSQKGKVGIALYTAWYEPKTNSTADVEAADRTLQFTLGIYAHPIFSVEGDYPEVVKQMVGRYSQQDGWFSSRLPALTQKEIEEIRGSADFLGLNYYTSMLAEDCSGSQCEHYLFTSSDAKVSLSNNPDWPTSGSSLGPFFYPFGFRKLFNWIKEEYNNPPVIVTESGWILNGNSSNIDDQERIQYYNGYLENIWDALMEDKCDIQGYTVWSLMDSFEWNAGYTKRFGLYYVDFNDPDRPRTIRKSANFFKNVIQTGQILTPQT